MTENKKRTKKGISLVECIIAIAIVVVISVTAIGFINSFSTTSAQMINTGEALSNFENVRQLYIYAQSQEEFDSLLPVVSDIDYDVSRSMYIYDNNGYYGYFIVHIKNAADENDKSSFTALIKDSKNATIVELENFTKIE